MSLQCPVPDCSPPGLMVPAPHCALGGDTFLPWVVLTSQCPLDLQVMVGQLWGYNGTHP